jgi:excinuclease ABC subunit B
MLREMGYCSGIGIIPATFGQEEGERPAVLLDYFPDDFLCFIDESH